MGIITQPLKLKIKVITGATKNKFILDDEGIT
jgi:hypothetical protein